MFSKSLHSRISLGLIIYVIFHLCSLRANGVETSMISPYYFGPNAFPVPEIVDTTSSRLRIDAEVNYYHGYRKDHTTDVTLRAVIPLWTPRANLTVFLPVMEWYRHSEEFLKACNINPPYTDSMLRGHLTGDVYISTDLHVLKQKKYVPDMVVRAGLKTASGGSSENARYYDSPGYFFDLTLGKTFTLSAINNLSFRLALEGGFLCWQTGVDRQNDAVMFGIKAQLNYGRFKLAESFSGYSGWEHLSSTTPELARDTPATFKSFLSYDINRHFTIFGAYDLGLLDFPYSHFKLGLSYYIDVLKKK